MHTIRELIKTMPCVMDEETSCLDVCSFLNADAGPTVNAEATMEVSELRKERSETAIA